MPIAIVSMGCVFPAPQPCAVLAERARGPVGHVNLADAEPGAAQDLVGDATASSRSRRTRLTLLHGALSTYL